MAVRTRWTVDCGDPLGPGDAIGVRGVDPSGAVVRILQGGSAVAERLVLPDDPTFVIPATPHGWEAMAAYLRLGIQHILSGPDHLLFVFGLVLLSGTLRRIAATVTAFTVGHSLTLAAAVLGYVHFWQPAIEAAIAASVFALAVELARDPREPTAMRRHPWVMAGLFGILHGLGFATVLTDAGLSRADLPPALLAFNVGIEVGQLLFVEAVLALRWLVGQVPVAFPAWTRAVPLYAMGTLAAYWWLERTAAMLR
jgi:hydrogenase/urease accessory protein HupE